MNAHTNSYDLLSVISSSIQIPFYILNIHSLRIYSISNNILLEKFEHSMPQVAVSRNQSAPLAGIGLLQIINYSLGFIINLIGSYVLDRYSSIRSSI
jgi:hypothetical protein